MCGFAGFFDFNINLKENEYRNIAVVRRMQRRLLGGAGFDSLSFVTGHSAVSYTKPENDNKISFYSDGSVHVILSAANDSSVNAEQVYRLYSKYGRSFPDETACGCFGIVIDETCKVLMLFNISIRNDTLYYMLLNGRILVATEIKGLLEYPGAQAILSLDGIQNLFDIGKSPKCSTVFDGIASLPPFCCVICSAEAFSLTEQVCSSSERSLCEHQTAKSPDRYAAVSSCKPAEERMLSFLLESAVIRDRPTYSSQDDILFLCHQSGKSHGFDVIQPSSRAPCALLRHDVYRKIRMKELQNVYDCARATPVLTEESVHCTQCLPFGFFLQTKLKAIMRDKSQPIHRLISSDVVNRCLALPERFERSLFFVLQLSLWINHYRVFIRI